MRTSSQVTYIIPFTLVCVAIFETYVNADEILGCNGFVKSDIDIDFSRIEIKLYTKQGSFKDLTECAPTNGYYFLPLYDHGEYNLNISSPDGWSFEPSDISLTFDGVSDPCSKGEDINFVFKGFAVSGKVVSRGSTEGPKGVTVELFVGNRTDNVLRTLTVDGGGFLFTPVLPGSHGVVASHPSWRLAKTRVDVIVSKGNAGVPANSLVVAGYDVSGRVTSDTEPITGVAFALFTLDAENVAGVEGCSRASLAGFSSAGLDVGRANWTCHVTSDMDGRFTFPCLPPGHYALAPHYATPYNITFHVRPRLLQFRVAHGSLQFDTPFEVTGFSVSGRVLLRRDGPALSGASIRLNGKHITMTAADGMFHLDGMRAGNYSLLVEAEDVQFVESAVKVTPNTPHLGDLVPAAYRVCGSLQGTDPSQPRAVTFTPSGGGAAAGAEVRGDQFCVLLPPAVYTAAVSVSQRDADNGLRFTPSSRTVDVLQGPVSGVDFSQLRATLHGLVRCLARLCPTDIAVTLMPVQAQRQAGRTTVMVAKDGAYQLTNVLPGDYEVRLDTDQQDWCWEETALPLSVTEAMVEGPTFVQTGYAVTIVSSHDTKVRYSQTTGDSGQKAVVGEVSVNAGNARLCLTAAGPFVFEPVGCHTYSPPSFQWVASGGPIVLTAATHALTGRITTAEKVDDLIVSVVPASSSDNRQAQMLGPLKGVLSANGDLSYEFTTQLSEGQVVTLIPAASALIFSPATAEVIGARDCRVGARFSAERGLLLAGRVIRGQGAPLAGTTVTVLDGQGEQVTTQLTDAAGAFRFSPLSPVGEYRVVAEKEGYVLTGPDKAGVFHAHKLAEIIVSVKDAADGTPLQGVLLSLSGGRDYRKTSQTAADGQMAFRSLSPDEYFLRPMMKEYRFSPPSKMVPVTEGATINVQLSGERTAYSVLGSVTSLSGEAEGGVLVEAVGTGPLHCTQLQEEAVSEAGGQLRIRGLQPQCEYTVRVKQGADSNAHIQRSTPDGVPVKVASADVHGIRLIVFRAVWRTDVTALVSATSPADLRTLRLRLSREESPDVALHTVRLSDCKPTPHYALSTALLALPPLVADGRGYTLSLESNLAQATHSYAPLRPAFFRTNVSFHLVRFSFSPVPRTSEPELNHSSYLTLPLFVIAILGYFYRVPLAAGLTSLMQARVSAAAFQPRLAPPTHSDVSVTDALIVEPVIIGKRKVKLRKT